MGYAILNDEGVFLKGAMGKREWIYSARTHIEQNAITGIAKFRGRRIWQANGQTLPLFWLLLKSRICNKGQVTKKTGDYAYDVLEKGLSCKAEQSQKETG